MNVSYNALAKVGMHLRHSFMRVCEGRKSIDMFKTLIKKKLIGSD